MTLFEVIFRITHDCPFGNISRRFPSLRMFVWCNREHEIYEVIVEKLEDYQVVLDEISKLGEVTEVPLIGIRSTWLQNLVVVPWRTQ